MSPMDGETNKPANAPDVLDDCRAMLRFALREALPLSDELRGDVACMDLALKHFWVSGPYDDQASVSTPSLSSPFTSHRAKSKKNRRADPGPSEDVVPKIRLHCWLWLLMLGQFTEFVLGEETSRFVRTQAGELPIILSAPHGGKLDVPDVAVRKGEGLAKGGSGVRSRSRRWHGRVGSASGGVDRKAIR